MPDIETFKKQRPAYSVCLVGPQGSGKTQAGCGFPKVYYIGTDPTGLDTIFYQEQCAPLVNNLVHVEILNGLPLDQVFANDENDPTSIFGSIAYATKLAEEGKVKTIFIDNLTYLIDPMKWNHIDGDGQRDKRQAFGQVAAFASDLVLSRLLPLAPRKGINIVIAMHIQRESRDAVEGVSEVVLSSASSNAKKMEQLGQSKRHINLKSDLSPMVMGSLRQKIGGMPSAMLWLNNETSDKGLQYLAYTQKQYVPAWDAEIEAKNRYGLPPVLNLTNASLYATLVQASKKAIQARPEAKAATATNSQLGESPALDAQPTNTTETEKEIRS